MTDMLRMVQFLNINSGSASGRGGLRPVKPSR
jgi:hypothetical protein